MGHAHANNNLIKSFYVIFFHCVKRNEFGTGSHKFWVTIDETRQKLRKLRKVMSKVLALHANAIMKPR